MEVLSSLEQAVLDAIALQVAKVADAFAGPQVRVHVTARKNTGAGFCTTLDVSPRSLIEGVASPVGDVGAAVAGLEHGMGFLGAVTFINSKATLTKTRLASTLSE